VADILTTSHLPPPAGSAPRAIESPEPDLWRLVGNTPLLPVELADGVGRIWLKAEWLNPGGSVKDRPAREILRAGRAVGALPHHRLLDASSGNTAVAYAMLGAAAGIGITVCVPENVSPERMALLSAYGAEVIPTDPLAGSDGAIRVARDLAARAGERFWYADQYANPANPLAHVRSTGPEIWRATEGRVTHLVAGIGTSGTLMGTGEFLRQKNPVVQLVAVQPEGPLHGLEGLKHLATALVPPIYNPAVPDETVFMATERADAVVAWLARSRGLFVGWSTGAAIAAAEDLVRRLASVPGPEPLVVVIAPDGGPRYLSEASRRLGIQEIEQV